MEKAAKEGSSLAAFYMQIKYKFRIRFGHHKFRD